MTYYLSLFFATIILLSCSSNVTKYDSVMPDKNYPRWLKTKNYRTSQTSGIAFIREDENGSDEFLLVDDIGKMHMLKISSDTIFTFMEVKFSDDVTEYLNSFPKIDFEEIAYDKFTNEFYLTIEGNGPDFLKYNGIYKVKFEGDNVDSKSVVGIEKLEIKPKEIFTEYVKANIGYEGLAVSEKYLFLGLEAILNSDKSFSNNTLVMVVNKVDYKIIKKFYTENFNIGTICGLYAESDSEILGIDRNNRILFNFIFDDSLNVISHKKVSIKTLVPSYHQIEYTGSLESLTMNERDKIFLVDDPWFSRFVPDSSTLKKLDQTTVKNFKEFVPIIYKFNLQ